LGLDYLNFGWERGICDILIFVKKSEEFNENQIKKLDIWGRLQGTIANRNVLVQPFLKG